MTTALCRTEILSMAVAKKERLNVTGMRCRRSMCGVMCMYGVRNERSAHTSNKMINIFKCILIPVMTYLNGTNMDLSINFLFFDINLHFSVISFSRMSP